MDIRYRCRKIAEHAPIEQKIRFYQARYDQKRLYQMLCFAQMLAGRSAAVRNREYQKTVRTHGNAFADYGNRAVFSYGSIAKELQNYDVISFDVFDTLIRRTVRHPTDIFSRIEQQTGIPKFAVCRIEAENAARQYRYARHLSAEVSIEEIYRIMLQDSRINGWCTECKAEQNLQAWIGTEMEMEKQCCRADPWMQKLVSLFAAQNKRVIAVSDMYLHQAQVQELLQLCGYKAFREIYVSCDYRAGKSDGRLFPRILQRIGPDKSLVHIGDNFYADVYQPKELGIRTFHYIADVPYMQQCG